MSLQENELSKRLLLSNWQILASKMFLKTVSNEDTGPM
jgi:hypothetical protein